MYKEFFGLRDHPFNETPDPRFLFLTQRTEESLACLIYGIESRKGFVLLTGEVGTGKTTLVNKVLERLREKHISTAFIFNPLLTVPEFLKYMTADFGVPCDSSSKGEILRCLNNWLLERYRAGETVVLIVDEAQNLSDELLEEIRLLTNLETFTGKLLQVVLVGQPELEQKLKQSNLRQLRQRLTMRAKTHPFGLQETEAYVTERLRIAGTNELVFESQALAGIHRFSGGIPRLVNVLCEHSLVNAFADGRKTISIAIVEGVAREFDLEDSATHAAIALMGTAPRLEKFDMVDALKSFGTWLTSHGGEDKAVARKGNS